jgi:hypothetical protein
MKKVLILSSLFAVVCFAVVNLAIEERNASMSLQTENAEALTVGGPVVLETCYMNVSVVSGTGVYFYKCNSFTSTNGYGNDVVFPCIYGNGAGTRVESSQSSVSNPKKCYNSAE